jgi:hypothetical protein
VLPHCQGKRFPVDVYKAEALGPAASVLESPGAVNGSRRRANSAARLLPVSAAFTRIFSKPQPARAIVGRQVAA